MELKCVVSLLSVPPSLTCSLIEPTVVFVLCKFFNLYWSEACDDVVSRLLFDLLFALTTHQSQFSYDVVGLGRFESR